MLQAIQSLLIDTKPASDLENETTPRLDLERFKRVAIGLGMIIALSAPVSLPLALNHFTQKQHQALPISSSTSLSGLKHSFFEQTKLRLESDTALTLVLEKNIPARNSYSIGLQPRIVTFSKRNEYTFEFQTNDGKTHSIFANSTDLRNHNIKDYVLTSYGTREDGGVLFYLTRSPKE